MERDEFRNTVFERDGHRCVACGKPARDAHHIMERRLFHDGGYVVDNGVSLCGPCHILAEKTLLTPSTLRERAGITRIVLPEHLYPDYEYDKWGNIVCPDKTRVRGELFYDEGVQKILPQEIKNLFLPYVKYPRTYHVPWTQSTTSDDRVHSTRSMTDCFSDREVVVTEKRDGENASIYWDGYFHARSIDGHSHPSQSWLKNFAQQWCYDLPTGWRVCGENLYALHSIPYDDLVSYFEVFGIWNEHNAALCWDETKEWCSLLGLEAVPELWRGVYDENALRTLATDLNTDEVEGYVMRTTDAFTYAEYRYCTAKFVRRDHVQSTVHNWRRDWRPSMTNKLTVCTSKPE